MSASEAPREASPISCEKSAKVWSANIGTWPSSSWQTSGSAGDGVLINIEEEEWHSAAAEGGSQSAGSSLATHHHTHRHDGWQRGGTCDSRV
jgi:hypothetical protein